MVRDGLRSGSRAAKAVAVVCVETVTSKTVAKSKKVVKNESTAAVVAAVVKKEEPEVASTDEKKPGRKRKDAPTVGVAAVIATDSEKLVTAVKKIRGKVVVKTEAEVEEQKALLLKAVGPLPTSFPLVGNALNGSPVNTGLKYVGAHVSAAGSLEIAIQKASAINAKSFALFLASQRQWTRKPLEDEVVLRFREAAEKAGFAPHLILPHGSYLMNLGAPNPETLRKSRDLLVEELQRCERLGLTQYNFHPGSCCGEITREVCISLIAEGINMALEKTKFVVVLLENMSKQGHTIGGDFAELRDIIDLINDKTRIGVCLDTCHAFAAGYDLRTEEDWKNMIKTFDEVVGLKYLKAMHINDSKGDLGCKKDRHENIGKGKITKDGFVHLMNMPEFNDIPLILETPWESDETYKREIEILNGLNAANVQ